MPEAPHPKLHAHPARQTGGGAVLPPPPVSRPSYAELYCLSNFSFLRGASHPEELIERAGELGYAALAITDRNSLAGVVRAHVAAQSWNRQHPGRPLRLIIGAEVTPLDAPPLVLLATDRAAYGRLARLLTRGKRRARKGRCELYLADVAEMAEGLVAIVAPRDAEADEDRAVAGPLRRALETCRGLAARLAGLFLAAPLAYEEQDELRFERLLALSERSGIPLLACNHVHYHVPQRRYLQDVLTCIRTQCTLADAGRRLFANAERHLRPIDDVYLRYGGFADPRLASAGRAAVVRTLEVAARCTFGLDELRYDYPSEVVPAGLTAMEYLEQETWAGARTAFAAGGLAASPPAGSAGHPAAASADAATCPACPRGSPGPCRCSIPPDTRALLTAELDLIRTLRYEHYFLTVYDIVQFARTRGILCQGRGSAANSAVCYVLGITAVDPTRHDLLFERFISKERNEPPDIDVDFEHERREEVFQYIYEKYGRERAAITAEVISYRPRSAIRDVGKVLGLSLDRLDVLAKSIDWFNGWDRIEHPDQDRNQDQDRNPDQDPEAAASSAAQRSPLATLHEQLAGAGLDAGDRTVRMLVRLVRQLLGFPRHLSQHVGGFVITQTPLCEIVPLENGAMPGRTFIEWDKDDIDALGILKVDCLALGMLTALSKCLRMLKGLRDSGIEGLREEGAGDQGFRDLGIKGLREEGAAFSLIPQSLNPSIPEIRKQGFRDLGIKGLREEGAAFCLIPQSLNPSIPQGDPYERQTHVPRSDRLEEVHRIGQDDLCNDVPDARLRAIRVDQSDSPGCRIDREQHRGGQCAPDSERLYPLPDHGPRLPGGIGNPDRDRPGTEVPASQPGAVRRFAGGIQDAAGPDYEAENQGLRDLGIKGLREENAAFSSIPQSLNPSVPQSIAFSLIPQSLNPSIPEIRKQGLRDLGIKGLREEGAAFCLIPQSLNPSIPEIRKQGLRDLGIKGLREENAAFSSIPQSLNPSIPQSIAFSLIPQSLNPSIPSLRDIPPEDPVVYDMICAADTIGVFQIESRAQMSMLPRLRPRCFYDLVIEVAIVRPGPIQGGMVHPYLRRRDGLEPVSYPSPQVERVLSKTLGVPLFQEQVMRLAVVAAGFTPGESDQLRRAMAAWRRGGSIEKFRRKLILGMLERGYSKTFAEQIFRQIEGFGEYGFPESHAASFALLVYASAWLKCYHPAAFCAAMLNSFPLGFYTPGQLVRDALAHGVRVLPVDVNASGWDCTLEDQPRRPAPALRLGLRLVRGLSEEKLSGVVAEQRRGPIRSLRQLARRSDVARDTLIRLAAADAFRSLGLSRRQAFWHILALDDADLRLFDELATPEDPQELPEMSSEEIVIQDYEMIGFSLAAHPLGLIRTELDRIGGEAPHPARPGTSNGAPATPIVPNDRLRQMKHGVRVAVAGLVTVRQRPGTAKGTTFMTLEDETGFANLVVWPKVWEREWRVARSKLALVAEGRIERQGEVIHVMVQRFYDISKLLGPLRDTARNFH